MHLQVNYIITPGRIMQLLLQNRPHVFELLSTWLSDFALIFSLGRAAVYVLLGQPSDICSDVSASHPSTVPARLLVLQP